MLDPLYLTSWMCTRTIYCLCYYLPILLVLLLMIFILGSMSCWFKRGKVCSWECMWFVSAETYVFKIARKVFAFC